MKYNNRGILLSTVLLLTCIIISLYGAYNSSLQIPRFIKEKELPAVGLAVSARLNKAADHYKEFEVTDTGIHSDKVKKLVATFEKEYGVRIQLARKDGKVVYTTAEGIGEELTAKTQDVLIRNQNAPMGIVFEGTGKSSSIFWGTYLSDWNSYLVVEKQGEEIEGDMRESMLSSFLPLGGLALVLFLISIFTIRSTFKVMKASLEKKDKELSLQKTALRFAGRFVRTLDTTGEYKGSTERLLLWANNTDENKKENMPPEEVLEPALLSISTWAERYNVSLHSSLEKSGLFVDRDGAFALDLAVREICRHIFEIAVSGLIIPIAGRLTEKSYNIEIASNIRGSYFSAEILEEVRGLLSLAGISLSAENSSQSMLNIIISIPR